MDYAYLDENYKVVPTEDILEAREKTGDRKLLKQEHYKGYFISTVFLTLDHGYNESGVHFETYVFKSDGKDVTSWCEVWGRRAKSYEAALKDHQEAKDAIDNGTIEQDE